MRRIFAVLLVASAAPSHATSVCGDAPFDRATLERDAQTEFASYDDAQRQALALALLPCLESPDPKLRDDLAYTILAWQIRKGQLTPKTLHAIEAELRDRLFPNDGSGNGFRHTFAALALASVAAADARAPFLDDAERERLLLAATRYLIELRDWRGYDEREGWRHGVAHGADLVAVLASHPKLGPEALGAILDAAAHQVSPPGAPPYVFGEPERLATAIVAVAKRGIVGDAAWQKWLDRVAAPAPFAEWNAVWSSLPGLTKRHNTIAFLSALELALRGAEPPLAVLAGEVAKRRTM